MTLHRRELLPAVVAPVLLSGLTGATVPPPGGRLPDGWTLSLCPDHGVATLLGRREAAGFSFVPRHPAPVPSGAYALGDIDLRVRAGDAWSDLSTAFNRRPIRHLPVSAGEIAAADLSPSLPPSAPVAVERRWTARGDELGLRFILTNRSTGPIEIGSLGIPLPFDNMLTGRTLAQAHAEASFTDPYIGLDAGYAQVTRLNGAGPALLVLPEPGTPLEAWAPILEDAGDRPVLMKDRNRRGQTFEGFYRWMIASKGHADRDWRGAEQWNEPTSFTLAPGERRTVGLRFVAAPAIRAIEDSLARAGHPVAVGVPGYVLAPDCPGDLFVKAADAVASIEVSPPGALAVTRLADVGGWQRLRIDAKAWGRARLTLVHANNSRQTVHYRVTKPAATAVADLGRFLFSRQWYDEPDDRFCRSPSIMSFDRGRNAIVLQDKRVWIAGLSDEGGAGSWLAAIAKQLVDPVAGEVARFERFHTGVIERHLQVPDGPEAMGVRKSLFHYDPARRADYDPAIDWTTWASWKPDQARSVGRSFNYVHVAAAQWILYRLARNRVGLVRAHDWRWYLERAAATALAMPRLAPDYARFGQMEGTVLLAILSDLRREGMTAPADALDAAMRARAHAWQREAFPFGSEMPWDSTGQEEVYAWMRYVGDDAKAALTREVILGYDPLIPHWGYNGNARRYWDFLYAGKTARIERQIHHYGSSLNALPLFDAFRRDPADIHLLRVAYGGMTGVLANIDRDGFGACAFHSQPDTMRHDDYSGDYGMGFLGHALGTASTLLHHPVFGWTGFGGIVTEENGTVAIEPRDSARARLFIASERLWLVLDAGRIRSASLDPATGEVKLTFDPEDAHTPAARLVIDGRHRPVGGRTERGAYVTTLLSSETTVKLVRG